MAGGGPIGLVARADLRRRWIAVVAVGLLFGLAGGVALACLAGARRSASVFDRHLLASDGPDIEIDPGSITPEVESALASLPHVTSLNYWVTFSAFPLTEAGEFDEELAQSISFTTDGRYLTKDRVAVSAGRRLDPTNPSEVMINQSYADAAGFSVGSTFELAIVETDEDGLPLSMEPPDDPLEVTVTGIMVLNEEITSEEIDIVPRLFVSPAARTLPVGDPAHYGFAWYGLQVEGGEAAVAEVVDRWQQLANEHNAGLAEGDEGWLTYIHRTSDLRLKAARAMRPLVTTIAAFGALVLFAAVVLVSQSLGRGVRSRRLEASTTRMLGLTPWQALLTSLVVPACSLGLALAVGAAAAAAASLAFPVGPFSVLEPSPGLALDLTILVPGLALLVALPLLFVTLVAWREARGPLASRQEGRSVSRLVRLAGRSGRTPSVNAALRLTFDPGQGRTFVPTRSMLVSVTVTMLALVTVVVFGSNLQALDRDPTRFGWPSDGVVASDGGYGPFDKAKATTVLDASPEVDTWRFVGGGTAVVDGRRVPSLVLGEGDESMAPTMLSGRPPQRPGELVVGAGTLRSLGARVGDEVVVGEGSQAEAMVVTGTAVFPVIGPVLATRTGLDIGAWLDLSAYRQIDAISAFVQYGLPDEPQYSIVLFDLAEGGSVTDLQREVYENQEMTFGSSIDVFGAIRPAEVRTAAAGGGRTQVLLAGILALAAGASTLLALAAVVRRRRAELAVYRVLGFRPSQVRATLLWQGSIMTGVGVVVGLPLGIAIGRVLWRAFAARLGVVPDPTLPVMPLLMAAVAALLVGLLGALGPAIAASRVSPAVGVRAE